MSDAKSLNQIAASYATASAGMHSSHTLPLKLEAIADAGFKWAEIAFPDLEQYASSKYEGYRKVDVAGAGDLDKLLEATGGITELCRRLGVRVLTVMPFSQFEGYGDSARVEQGLKRARSWFKVLKALNCQMLQVGSSDDTRISSNFDVMASNLRALADEANAQDPPIRIAYEMWAWGTHVNSWEHTWEICKRVNRPNFGLCLDTFQISALHLAAEVSLPSSLLDTVPPPQTTLSDSLNSLTTTLAPHIDKIFYLQISDGARVSPVKLDAAAKKQGIHVLYTWSNEHRPLSHQIGLPEGHVGFLPVLNVIDAVLETGWRGPWSYEVFYAEDQSKDDPDIPKRWTYEAMTCHAKLISELESRKCSTRTCRPAQATRIPDTYDKGARITSSAPNVDTLYSITWLDLREEPVVLSIPETDGRYHVFQLLYIYTDTFADIGSRAVGYSVGQYAIVYPGFNGFIPGDLPLYESPSWDVWVEGRTLVSNESDVTTADAIVVQYNLTALTDLKPYSHPPSVSLDCTSPLPSPQTPYDAGSAYFDELATVFAVDPQPSADAPALQALANLGVTPGGTPTETANITELTLAVAAGELFLEANASSTFPGVPAGSGWRSSINGGTYCTDYLTRAGIARVGLGANIPAESVYFISGAQNGTRMNLATFVLGTLPPIEEGGFWSVTVYNTNDFLSANAENRYAFGDRSNLTFEADRSLIIYFSNAAPPDNATKNWIPAPNGIFEIFVRSFVPPTNITDYSPPAITQV
ncbi:hypothetical protein EW145_g6653 [Phellinidium pouzarii]|uniref:Xylose isomerase-like TIM barrel domain-containing protein n=1 Tax=Phellinidium pouzarii TaxID=167371 RepID=A0A4S4L0N5_9AGAM|nr:hypothetical protein EW145_g6653 [Phellinidium pouzarii]